MTAMHETRTCRKCGKDKPLNEFGWRDREKTARRTECSDCLAAYRQAYREANRDALAAKSRARYAQNRDAAKAQQAQYREANRETLRERNARWKAKNREAHLSRRRALYAQNAETERAKRKAYVEANRESVRASLRRSYKKRAPERRKRRRDYVRRNWFVLIGARYEALARKYRFDPVNTLTEQEWQAIVDAHDGLCAYCKTDRGNTIDHVLPVSRGGQHTKDNVLPACTSCNSSKGNKTVEEWLATIEEDAEVA